MPTDDFHEVQFPFDYAEGVTMGVQYMTRVVVSDSGDESRTQMWDNGRLTAQIEYVADPSGMAAIISFFRNRKGRTYGFRFRDWTDYEASHEVIVTNPTMQLRKTYTDDANTEVRIITKPCDNDTFQLFDNGSPVASTVDWTTGIVTPTSYHSGHTYSWSGEFDVPMRFDIDKLGFVMNSVGRQSLQSTPLIEVSI